MVPIQLEIDDQNPDVGTDWVDALFDRFDEDDSNTIDDDEWDNVKHAQTTTGLEQMPPLTLIDPRYRNLP